MSYSRNSLKGRILWGVIECLGSKLLEGGHIGDYIGSILGVDTGIVIKSLDNSSNVDQ